MRASLPVAAERIRAVNTAPVRPGRRLVLHWMRAARRTGWNEALQRAVELARELERPLLVVETIACDEPWASDRHHAFVLRGMADNARRLGTGPVAYHPLVERRPGQALRLLVALGREACVVTTDDWPGPAAERSAGALGRRLDVRLEAIDAATVMPFRLAGREFPTAYLFRRHLQRHLPAWLDRPPAADPVARLRLPPLGPLPAALRRWPATPLADLLAPGRLLASLPLDHQVPPVGRGGARAAAAALRRFVEERLSRYHEDRDQPDLEGTSGLSAWLHHGQLSPHQVLAEVLASQGWTARRLSPVVNGARQGWWGTSPPAEAFLDQLVTWRELGFGWSAFRADATRLTSLPRWALATLRRHAADPRHPRYTLRQLEAAATHDPLWNAAQRQLLEQGTIHNRLRMLWGKKILEWSSSPARAVSHLFALNDRWALDGRDPNSASGLLWCLGRHDRPWAPERPVFGTVRFMSSAAAMKKHQVRRYLARFSPRQAGRSR